jgi:hypothetical protein
MGLPGRCVVLACSVALCVAALSRPAPAQTGLDQRPNIVFEA